jgi:hypothetical protein
MKKQKKVFDIVFLCHEKDIDILRKNLEFAKKNISSYRKIFIVSKENYFPENKDLIFIPEKNYPFNKIEIAKHAPGGRAGWYYQQFLKLYFLPTVGKRALDNVLVIDADCAFIKETKFFEKDKPLYNFEIGYHDPYYNILEKVFGFGNQLKNKSGTVHHMLYQRKYILEILDLVRKKWKKELWQVIMKNADKDTVSGFSEQELYLNYVLKYHKGNVVVRRIKFVDFPYNGAFWVSVFKSLGYHYIASHDYLQKQRFSALRAPIIEFFKVLGLKIFIKRMLIKLKVLKKK